METIEELRASRERLLNVISAARHKLFEQDQIIDELRSESVVMQKTIGELRAEIVWLKTRQCQNAD